MLVQKESSKAGWGVILETLKVQVLSAVSADKVLLLSPHPDDDAIGCGGLIKSLTVGGAKVKIIYFTDGARGNSSGRASQSLIAQREEEARAAGKILGAGEEVFWRMPDGKVEPTLELASRIRREIEFDKPDLILAPSFEELHPDHFAVAEILAMSLKNYQNFINIWFYEVWGTARYNRIFVIDDFVDDKKQAIRCHKSQLKIKKYDEAILALNHYRGLSTKSGEFAEAYYACGPRTMRRLFDFYRRHHESKF